MIDFEFIGRLEGFSLVGYIPASGTSNSGVTIASGFDIGQRNGHEIRAAFPMSLAIKLLPYTGKIKIEAKELLKRQPLKITLEESAIINAYSHFQAKERLIKNWVNSNSKVPFNDLSSPCQTVIASVAFQYGDLTIRTPNFWKQVTHGDWSSAIKNLRSFGDRYMTRRNKEADLLESWTKENLGNGRVRDCSVV